MSDPSASVGAGDGVPGDGDAEVGASASDVVGDGRGATHPGPSRRALLTGGLGVIGGVAVGYGAARIAHADRSESETPTVTTPKATVWVDPYGATQAGIARPAIPQHFGLVSVGDLDDRTIAFLPSLGREIARLTIDAPADLLPDGPAGLTVTVGLGPELVHAQGGSGPGTDPLPAFAADDGIDPRYAGGDLLITAYADDPSVLEPMLDRLVAAVPGYRPRWSQRCFRGPGEGTIVRNPLGFHDGVQVPRSDEEMAENVFLDGPLAGASICVIRRLQLDTARFHALPIDDRERIIGRRLDGSPLSGGEPFSVPNVDLKSNSGQYLIPARSHVRAAHPSFTGSNLMLRRGYSYDNGDGDGGLMFICFQRELRTFVLTQQRLDRLDDLAAFITPTASATFLILPGFTAGAAWPDRLG